jgi:uncharacterized membrane protein YbhN (UPF0104 family)
VRKAEGPSGARRALKLSLQLLVTIAVTWFILRVVGFSAQELLSFDLSELRPRWGLLVFSSSILFLAYLYSAALWGLMVREISAYEVPILASLRIFFLANLGRYLPGKLWQIAGLAYLGKREGVPASTATGAAVLGQGFSLAGATLVGLGVLLESAESGSVGGRGAILIVLLALVAATAPPVLKAFLSLWFRLAREEIPAGFRPDSAFGLRWMGLYALGWILQGLAFWVLVLGMGLELTALDGIPAFSAAYVAGYVALFAPAGAGIREGVLVAVLAPVLGAGAGLVAVVARLWTTCIELALALLLGMGYVRLRRREGGG